jgi:DNA-binding transcriptional MerR regulator
VPVDSPFGGRVRSGPMRAALSIGDFTQITHLSVKTLRHYHEAGLLQPAEVDPHTGCRYYATTEVPTAQVIRRFRELGMPVREVRQVLCITDPVARGDLPHRAAGHPRHRRLAYRDRLAGLPHLRQLTCSVRRHPGAQGRYCVRSRAARMMLSVSMPW